MNNNQQIYNDSEFMINTYFDPILQLDSLPDDPNILRNSKKRIDKKIVELYNFTDGSIDWNFIQDKFIDYRNKKMNTSSNTSSLSDILNDGTVIKWYDKLISEENLPTDILKISKSNKASNKKVYSCYTELKDKYNWQDIVKGFIEYKKDLIVIHEGKNYDFNNKNVDYQLPDGFIGKVFGGLSNAREWKAMTYLGNNSDAEIGELCDVGYVMVSSVSDIIIPISRGDEHHTGFDLVYDYYVKDKELKNVSTYRSFFYSSNFLFGTLDNNELITHYKCLIKYMNLGGVNTDLTISAGIEKNNKYVSLSWKGNILEYLRIMDKIIDNDLVDMKLYEKHFKKKDDTKKDRIEVRVSFLYTMKEISKLLMDYSKNISISTEKKIKNLSLSLCSDLNMICDRKYIDESQFGNELRSLSNRLSSNVYSDNWEDSIQRTIFGNDGIANTFHIQIKKIIDNEQKNKDLSRMISYLFDESLEETNEFLLSL